MTVEEQVVSIFSGVNGYLDNIKATDVTRFEKAFLAEIRANHDNILTKIATEQKISDEVSTKLKTVLEKFSQAFA